MTKHPHIIIGAGPAGMACAHTLAKAGEHYTVYDKFDQPGGLCRTLHFNGYLFDIGGHRFLTRSDEVNALWHDIMGDDLLDVKRISRIFYKNRFFQYPMNFKDVVLKLGPLESLACLISYLWRRVVPLKRDQDSFEQWVINAFGDRLYQIFFKTYTEKVWSRPGSTISSDWAQQRIKGLSLKVALKSMFSSREHKRHASLTQVFKYPRTGPGEFYRRLQHAATGEGCAWHFSSRVSRLRHDGRGKIIALDVMRGDRREEVPVRAHVFSSMPLPQLIRSLEPAAPDEILEAARALSFRSFLVVNVVLNRPRSFPDQWIYVQSPEVRLGRVQNYKNWSPAMVADMNKTSLGLEYFCHANDELWEMNDVDLINFAMNEAEEIGVARRRELINGFVARYHYAYPVYSMEYKRHKDVIRQYLQGFLNLTIIGRSGLFRYDNSDHALLTGIYAAKNYLGQANRDLWAINTDERYLES